MNACKPRVADQLANRQAKRMRQIFERIEVDIVDAAGQESVERGPISFVDNGVGARFRQAVLPQDRQDGGASERVHDAALRADRQGVTALKMRPPSERSGLAERNDLFPIADHLEQKIFPF